VRRQLIVPLISNDDEDYNNQFHFSTMTNSSTTNNNANATFGSSILYRFVSIRYISDCMPFVFYTILTNGKYTAFVLLSLYLLIISFWLPFWLISFVITEWGVYLAMIGSVYLIGRTIIRLIAFPGASQKVVNDIENEFAKYSVRMIETACVSFIDLATIFEPRDQSGEQYLDNRTIPLVPGLWRRVKLFRCRVLAVYIDVIRYIYQQESVTSLLLSSTPVNVSSEAESNGPYGPELTRYGNNRLSGDIGNVLALPVRCILKIYRQSYL
jgi:hypothetical protein